MKPSGSARLTISSLTWSERGRPPHISEGTKAVFTKAEIGAVLDNPASPPSGDLRLWQFTNTAVTTTTGVHGTVTGPWTTSVVIDTINGQPGGQVAMSPSFLFSSNASFGVWIRDWLMKSGS